MRQLHHGRWTVLENVIVGPVIASVSFVCSIGNVPLAAALWHGGAFDEDPQRYASATPPAPTSHDHH